MSKANNAADWYATTFKQWPKLAGSKPSAELLDTIHKLGCRNGKQALANAMYMRPEGATSGQIVMACGAPQLNKMRQLRDDMKLIRQVPTPKNEAGHTVYRIELTAKGTAKVAKVAAAPVEGDKPAKAKRKAKADKPAPVQPEAMPVHVDPVQPEANAQPQA